MYDEEMAPKVRATGMIAQLCRDTQNLEHLLVNGNLLQVRHGGRGRSTSKVYM